MKYLLAAPRVWIGTTLGGPQRSSIPDDDHMSDAYHPSIQDNHNTNATNEAGSTLRGRGSSCEAEQNTNQEKVPPILK